TAGTLTGSSVGGATLNDANLVTDLGAFSNATSGALSFTNAQSFTTTGTISDTVGALSLITTTGNISEDSAITGTGQTVTLTSAGTIGQTAGVITAGTLTGSSIGGATLNDANLVTDLGAFSNATSGALSFTNNQSFTTTGTISDTVGALSLITTTGNITEDSAITGTGQTVTLTSAGTISQTSGVITAGTLTGSS